jgi:putative ABC transport system permease protein
MGNKELIVASLLAIRSLQRGNRSSVLLTVLIIALVFTNMIYLPSLFSGIGQSITRQLVDYELSNVLVEPRSGDQYIMDLNSKLDVINGMPGVERATPHYSKGATLKFRQRILGADVRAIKPKEETYVSPLYTKMISGSYLGDADKGEAIIGMTVAGSATVKQEDEFEASLGGVGVGDSITIEYGNGFTRDYRVKGIFRTVMSSIDNKVYTTWEDMEEVTGQALDQASYITVKVKPGYTEKYVKDELLQYGTMEKVQTTQDTLSKGIGKVLQSFAIINMVSLIVSLIIAVVVLFIVIMIKTLNSRRQIGILKAIGVDKEVIMHSYGIQVIILAVLGITLGMIMTELLVVYMSINPITTPEWSASLYVTPVDLLSNAVILFIAAIVAGYIPAWQVSREDIQKAMRA